MALILLLSLSSLGPNWSFLFFLVFFACFTLFLKSQKHFFLTLMILEFLMMSNILILTLLINKSMMNYMAYFSFLTISVCEASMGLAILIKYSRFWGNEMVSI